MAYAFANKILGLPPIAAARVVSGTAPQQSGWNPPYGSLATAVDPTLGGGEFIWLQGGAAITLGTIVTYNQSTGVTTPAATGAIANSQVAVAMATIPAGSNGWYQVSGLAMVRTTGAVAANLPIALTATAGAVTQGAVAVPSAAGTIRNSNLAAASGAGVLATVQINRPFLQ